MPNSWVADLERENTQLRMENQNLKEEFGSLDTRYQELQMAFEKRGEELVEANKQKDLASNIKKLNAVVSGCSNLEAMREEQARAELAHATAHSRMAQKESELAAERLVEQSRLAELHRMREKIDAQEEAVRLAALESQKEILANGVSIDGDAAKLVDSGIIYRIWLSFLSLVVVSRRFLSLSSETFSPPSHRGARIGVGVPKGRRRLDSDAR